MHRPTGREGGAPTACIVARPLPIEVPLYLEEDLTLAVANVAQLGVGLGAVCADVVESLNAILKRAYNDHTACRGGGGVPGATALQREGKVVLQGWEWWFLKFNLPL